ncbi:MULTISPECIES: TetR/AcrR family transcriptional regulator [Actinoalloteichus]|uniref:Transcriptional regulator, TetR family n=1 Tax=Actinoalloteichus caeruleus DSM 43889 TaxID=1120930 RepID=A0ABT1JMF6_ACTCY|nr:TetR family transcriptional regulator [Actinoalloteichus caeruleus]MCP2333527.1 transcriptional regulator, TetR family [Actinoalloteichus caeruleus DSM 43889]
MRSGTSGEHSKRGQVPPEDLTTRARIRDTAIRLFGRSGFGVGVRAIATEAGVSPALVVHHFGSKDGLREECDRYVLRVVREAKSTAVETGASGTHLLSNLAMVDDYAPTAAYIVRSLAVGGGLASQFFDQMVQDAEEYVAAGVEAGIIPPSRDPAARARFLTLSGVGMLLLEANLRGPDVDIGEVFRDFAAWSTLPSLEVYTEGLFANRTFLDSYLSAFPNERDKTATDGGGEPGAGAG